MAAHLKAILLKGNQAIKVHGGRSNRGRNIASKLLSERINIMARNA